MPNVAYIRKTNAEALVNKNQVVRGLLDHGTDEHLEELAEYIKGKGTTLEAVQKAYKEFTPIPAVKKTRKIKVKKEL